MDQGKEESEEKNWQDLEPSHGVKVFLTVLYSLILLLGIVGNSITIRVTQMLQRNGYLQKNVTDHMVSLACSDLLVLLIGMPVELYSATWFPFSSASGDISCKIYNFLFEACSYATLLNVATLSFERYMAICHPFRYKSLSSKRTVHLILFAWLTSVLVALPLLVATGTEGHVVEKGGLPDQNLTFCTNLVEHWTMYRSSIFVAFIVYIVVLAVVAFMCRNMIMVLQKSNVAKTESDKVKTARKQTIIFIGLIVGALVTCWIPNQVRRLMTAAVPKSAWDLSYLKSYITLHPVADTFFYLSSVINPFLYNLSSRQFRQAFVQVLQCNHKMEHANRRTLAKSKDPKSFASSARSLRPLLSKTGNSLHGGQARDLNVIMLQSDGNTEPGAAGQKTKPSETEI
ncbi:G-protein coupled receptor 39 [Denticeps clupeoides]|uniref:G-protein coupled receptors family 1 profile domain-containing protein n=1 Tax=Denticeps clupeoides TaxID=299321 RepID=A0AAY4C9P5_9TELE|nr:G-protein coupled receptor 39 [Denticeps clupeoides]